MDSYGKVKSDSEGNHELSDLPLKVYEVLSWLHDIKSWLPSFL